MATKAPAAKKTTKAAAPKSVGADKPAKNSLTASTKAKASQSR